MRELSFAISASLPPAAAGLEVDGAWLAELATEAALPEAVFLGAIPPRRLAPRGTDKAEFQTENADEVERCVASQPDARERAGEGRDERAAARERARRGAGFAPRR